MPSDKGSKLCLSKDVFHSHFKEYSVWTESRLQAASFSVLKRLFHCLLASMLSLGSQSVFSSLFSCKPPSVLVGSSVVPTLQSFLPGKAQVSFCSCLEEPVLPRKGGQGWSIALCTLPCLLVPVVHQQPVLSLEGDLFCRGLPPPYAETGMGLNKETASTFEGDCLYA